MRPFFSICIPAFKNRDYLQILLESIASQTFKDFEVIITDDSPTNELEALCHTFSNKFTVQYIRNSPALGSPKNWNKAIAEARGQWIKIMHDDDWFADKNALAIFAETASLNEQADFIFSGYNQYEEGKLTRVQINSKRIIRVMSKNPYVLFLKNYIGHPSTTLIKNDRKDWYDPQTKWVVDFEFYIRCIQTGTMFYIPRTLVNIGINKDQITKQVFRNIEVEIPENIYLLNKLGDKNLNHIIVYDYYWRMFRNLKIRSIEEVTQYAKDQAISPKLKSMLDFQLHFSLPILRIGLFSKFLMTLSFLKNRRNKS